MSRKEYELAIKIAGEIEKSLPASARLAKSELRSISKTAAKETFNTGKSFSLMSQNSVDALQRINKVGDKVFKAVAKGAKVAGLGVAAGLGASIKAGAEFEAQMSTVQAISRSSDGDLKRLSETAEKYGKTTKFTATECGQGLEYMALAGYDAEKSIQMLPNVLNLAAAGEMELGRASDQVTDIQSALNLSIDETTELVDKMALTSSKTNTSVEQLGDAMLQVGGTAKTLSGGTTELSQTLGILADNGIKGSEGGTKLRNIILSLTAPTDKAAAALDALGINVADSEGNMRSVSDIMADLNKQLGGMGKVEKSAALKKIFNKTDIKAVNALLGTSKDRWSELTSEINNADGAAKDMANTKLDNLKGDFTLFKSALEGTGITIYKEIQEPLRKIVQGGTDWLQDFSEWFVENFPAIQSGIEDVGGALATLAQPFLAIGGFFLDNPTLLASAIGAIGAALITYKVVAGIQGLVTAISSITSISPIIGIIGAVAAAIGAVGTAVAITAKEAKRANLADHFGDIALGMNDIKDAARQIVGDGDLKTIDELFDSLSESSNISDAMKKAQESISKTRWKISAGLTISKDDTKSYVEDVKEFAQNAQKLIDQKGYEVSVSTKLLFGDGKQAKALNAENNAFYSELDGQMQKLTKQLNKYLDKALEDGLTPDTEAVINKTLEAMDEITQAISDAETQASWDVLGGEWSGRSLTADSFQELQDQINENLEKEYEGIDEAVKSQLTAINAKYAMGNITQAEAQKQKDEVNAEAAEKKRQATDKGVAFQFNTLMDTYGESIANGSLYDDQATRDAVYELTSKILESPGAGTSSVASILRTLQHASAEESGALSWINPFSSDSKLITALSGTQSSYADSQAAMAQFASQYVGGQQADASKQMVENYKKAGDDINGDMSDTFGDVENDAIMAGRVAGQNFFDGFKQATSQMSFYTQHLVKPNSGNYIPGAPSNVPVPHAKGGIFNRPHVGMVGEAGTESVIPVKRTRESLNLLKQTSAMMGVGGATFAPSVTINAQGADKQAVKEAASMSMKQFTKMYKQMKKDMARVAF